jgi:cell division protein FtsZ
MDLGLCEIQEIGEMIEEFTSDTSTVVIGTAIDMDMEGEIRVTVVATGLNGSSERKVKLVTNNQPEKVEISPSYIKPRGNTAVSPAVTNQIDNKPIDEIMTADKDPMLSEDYLDIPAFLRNQAD